MRLIALVVVSLLVGCSSGDGSEGHQKVEPPDVNVPPPDANSVDGGGGSGDDTPFIPPNKTPDSGGCFYGEFLYCNQSPGIILPSCGVVCNVVQGAKFSVLGPTCFTCTPASVVEQCGYVCLYPGEDGGVE